MTRFPVTISPTGTITATIDPTDVPAALDKVVAVMRGAGDGIVVDAGCVPQSEVERIAEALAAVLLGRAP